MKRGDVWSAATGSGFGSKPRPVIVVQDDAFLGAPTILVALLTDASYGREPIRPILQPDATNGLRKASALSADILVTVRQDEFGQQIGTLSAADINRVDVALMLVLGLARPRS